MLFYFPTEIELSDLPAALGHWLQLLEESPLDAVSLVQISLLGWRGDQRYYLRGKGGFAPTVIFDRCVDLAGKPLPEWVPRLSSALSENHDEDVSRRAAEWFGSDD
jgi:hypothetical protein